MDTTKQFYEIFSSEALAMYWNNVNIHMEDPYLAHGLFPSMKQTGLDLKWIKGKKGLPVALQPSAFDTKASLRDRIGFQTLETELPFFREGIRIGERDRQQIETFLASSVDYARPLIQRLYDDVSGLIEGADVQAERMRMQVIQHGSINIVAGDDQGRPVDYTYNFDVDGKWATDNNTVLVGDQTWIEANADKFNPMAQIEAIKLAARQRGTTLVRGLLTTKTLLAMVESASIKKAINPIGHENIYMTNDELVAYVSKRTGIQFEVYDKMFKDENAKEMQYMEDGRIVFVPNGTLGNTHYGTTPEEFELLRGRQDSAQTTIVNTGVAVTTVKEPHPVNVYTIVSEIVMPSFEQMDEVHVLKVF